MWTEITVEGSTQKAPRSHTHILCPYGRHLIVLFKSQKLTLKDVFGPNHFKFICTRPSDPSLSSSSSRARTEATLATSKTDDRTDRSREIYVSQAHRMIGAKSIRAYDTRKSVCVCA